MRSWVYLYVKAGSKNEQEPSEIIGGNRLTGESVFLCSVFRYSLKTAIGSFSAIGCRCDKEFVRVGWRCSPAGAAHRLAMGAGVIKSLFGLALLFIHNTGLYLFEKFFQDSKTFCSSSAILFFKL